MSISQLLSIDSTPRSYVAGERWLYRKKNVTERVKKTLPNFEVEMLLMQLQSFVATLSR